MDVLDGNAIAGALFAVFGGEMTSASGTCASCGVTRYVAEQRVYLRAPGMIVRCSRCDNVLMVLVEIHGVKCVDLRGLTALEPVDESMQ